MNPVNLETRVRILEEKMMGNETAIAKLDGKVDRVLENMSDFRAHTDERISALQAHTDNRFLEMSREFGRAHDSLHDQINGLHGQIGGLHGEISGVHGQIGGLHGEISSLHGQISDIHKSISIQTKWFLTVVLFSTGAIPALFKVLDHYF